MHAFLLTGNNITYIHKFIEDQNVKKIYFTLQKIDDSKELKKITKYSFSEKTAIIIESIDTATVETQNSFLKNLEEPNKNLIYILTTRSLENVLPTIISRCQVINSNNQNLDSNNDNNQIDTDVIKNIEDYLNLNIDEKFKTLDKIKDRGEAITFVENLILVKHSKNDFNNLKDCLNTLKNLKKNGNVSLQLTNLLVTSFS